MKKVSKLFLTGVLTVSVFPVLAHALCTTPITPREYANKRPDVLKFHKGKLDKMILHYNNNGKREGMCPPTKYCNSQISPAMYAKKRPDVLRAHKGNLAGMISHYNNWGKYEGMCKPSLPNECEIKVEGKSVYVGTENTANCFTKFSSLSKNYKGKKIQRLVSGRSVFNNYYPSAPCEIKIDGKSVYRTGDNVGACFTKFVDLSKATNNGKVINRLVDGKSVYNDYYPVRLKGLEKQCDDLANNVMKQDAILKGLGINKVGSYSVYNVKANYYNWCLNELKKGYGPANMTKSFNGRLNAYKEALAGKCEITAPRASIAVKAVNNYKTRAYNAPLHGPGGNKTKLELSGVTVGACFSKLKEFPSYYTTEQELKAVFEASVTINGKKENELKIKGSKRGCKTKVEAASYVGKAEVKGVQGFYKSGSIQEAALVHYWQAGRFEGRCYPGIALIDYEAKSKELGILTAKLRLYGVDKSGNFETKFTERDFTAISKKALNEILRTNKSMEDWFAAHKKAYTDKIVETEKEFGKVCEDLSNEVLKIDPILKELGVSKAGSYSIYNSKSHYKTWCSSELKRGYGLDKMKASFGARIAASEKAKVDGYNKVCSDLSKTIADQDKILVANGISKVKIGSNTATVYNSYNFYKKWCFDNLQKNYGVTNMKKSYGGRIEANKTAIEAINNVKEIEMNITTTKAAAKTVVYKEASTKSCNGYYKATQSFDNLGRLVGAKITNLGCTGIVNAKASLPNLCKNMGGTGASSTKIIGSPIAALMARGQEPLHKDIICTMPTPSNQFYKGTVGASDNFVGSLVGAKFDHDSLDAATKKLNFGTICTRLGNSSRVNSANKYILLSGARINLEFTFKSIKGNTTTVTRGFGCK